MSLIILSYLSMRFRFCLYLILFSHIVFGQTVFRLSGEISNPTERKVLITLYRDWVGEEEEYELALNEKNQFTFSTNISKIAYIDFYYADQGFHYWIVEPTNDIKMSFSANNFYQSMVFSGNGAKNWEYLLKNYISYEQDSAWEKEAESLSKAPIEQYFDFLDNEQIARKRFLESFEGLGDAFRDVRKADIVGVFQNYKINYLSAAKFENWTEENVKNVLKIDKFADSVQTFSLEYGNMFQNLMELYVEKSARRKKAALSNAEVINLIKSSYDKDKFSFRLIESVIAFKLMNLMEEESLSAEISSLVNQFLDVSFDRDLKNHVIRKVNFTKTISKGSPAKLFQLNDLNGKSVRLKDFLGKVVYLDFWASWCGPCIYDMAFLDRIKDKFKNEVVFIQISLDNEEEWREALVQYDLSGINLRVEENDPMLANYGVNGIPAYFLIDKKGNFAVSKVADPSQEEGLLLIKQIEEILKK